MVYLIKTSALLLVLTTLLGCATQQVSNSNQLTELVSLLEGEFDSSAQMRADTLAKVGKENFHGWVNRKYFIVNATGFDAPFVLVSRVYYGSVDKETYDKDEFLVWTLKSQPNSKRIIMSPQRFKNPDKFILGKLEADQFRRITPEDLQPAISGAACDIAWEVNAQKARHYIGTTLPCKVMSTTKNIMLNWRWDYTLSPTKMTISFSGINEQGQVLSATPSGLPYILNRVRSNSGLHANARRYLFDARSKSELTDAATMLKRELELRPDNHAAKLDLSYAAKRLRKRELLIQSINTVDDSTLDITHKAWFKALKANADDDFLAERRAWQNVVSMQADNPLAWHELAWAEYRLENYAAAVASIEAALKLQPNPDYWATTSIYYIYSKSAYRLGDFETALAAAEPGLGYPATRRATYYRQTLALMGLGQLNNINDRIATYREYSKRNGKVNEAALQSNIAFLYFEHGDYATAIQYARKGYELNSGFYQAFILAYALSEDNQATEAVALTKSMLKKHTDNPYLLAVQGWAQYRLGQLQQAEQSLINAARVAKRRNPAIERDLAIVQSRIKDPTLPEAPKARWFGD